MQKDDLLHIEPSSELYVPDVAVQAKLGQYPTPIWFAEALIQRNFPDLSESDMVIESSCGPGSFLMALPDFVPAIGVELDERTADIARINTGRHIITGDFTSVAIAVKPTLILGNPPFNLSLIDAFLNRSHDLLDDGGQVGWILPTYSFQTADRVVKYNEQWSLTQEMIPRNIYPGLSLPLLFARFRKERNRKLIGFALYHETAEMLTLKKAYREIINSVGKSVWKASLVKALVVLNGRAHLDSIYAEMESRKPAGTQWWKEQIRKVLRSASSIFRAEGDGWYSLISPVGTK